MSAYFWIITLSFGGPFLLSFDKKVAFYKQFWRVFLASITIAFPFIIWDIYFTENKIWGFTPEYLCGIYFINLPLEECLFFVVVPFACLFIHEVLKAYFPKFRSQSLARFFAFFFVLSALIFCFLNIENWYTLSACSITALLTIHFYFIKKVHWFPNFAFTYITALIPFLIVNGILTGGITENPIVWYNEAHIMGFRIYTIPFEDLYYNFDLLLPIIALFEFLKTRKSMI